MSLLVVGGGWVSGGCGWNVKEWTHCWGVGQQACVGLLCLGLLLAAAVVVVVVGGVVGCLRTV